MPLRRLPLSAILLTLTAFSAPSDALADTSGPSATSAGDVTVKGGADETGHNYTWSVTNRNPSPIVRIEFPHFGADVFTVPDGWQQGSGAQMNLVNVGRPASTGTCWATQSSPGLRQGYSQEFRMRVYAGGARRAAGEIKVTFANGETALIPGVELPCEPVQTSPWVGAVGMGLILGMFIFFRERRRRKQEAGGGREQAPQAP